MDIEADLAACDLRRPAVTYAGPPALRDSSELFSAIEPVTSGAAMLDLGCGPRDQSVPAGWYGLRYVGVDYGGEAADLLADAHSIPFVSESFDYVLSYAVLEHLYDPAVALREIRRVLRSGGSFVGTVSQGEPFHDSYFHFTAWGVLAAFRRAGFVVERMWPSYDTLRGLSEMGRYPRAVRPLIRAVDAVAGIGLLAPRKLFRWSERERQLDDLHRAAGICFVARAVE